MLPTCFFSQNNNTNIRIENGNKSTFQQLNEQRDKQGTYYYGNGEYLIVEIGNTFRTNVDNMERDALEKAKAIANSKGAYSYKKILSDKTKVSYGKFAQVKVRVQLIDKNGNPWLDGDEAKQNAKKQLLELKVFKDEGIITQEEYEKAAAPHKQILLGKAYEPNIQQANIVQKKEEKYDDIKIIKTGFIEYSSIVKLKKGNTVLCEGGDKFYIGIINYKENNKTNLKEIQVYNFETKKWIPSEKNNISVPNTMIIGYKL